MKPNFIDQAKKAFSENPLQAVIMSLFALFALVLGLGIVIAVFKHAGSILGALIALPFVFLIVYKIFTGFPAIFSAIIQVASILVIGLCLMSLAGQHQMQAEGKSITIFDRIKMADALNTEFGIPPFLSMLILTETGALIGIAAGVAFGLIAEASAGIVTASFNLSRINDSLKAARSENVTK